jgi:hypothetical protein
MDLARLETEVDALQDLGARDAVLGDRDMQVVDLEQRRGHGPECSAEDQFLLWP